MFLPLWLSAGTAGKMFDETVCGLELDSKIDLNNL